MSEKTIELVILRHGEADNAIPDRERCLTEFGRSQVVSQYQWLQQQKFQPELILHSPYKRTTETASLAKHFYPEVELQVEPIITPDGSPALAAQLIPTLNKQSILMASHMPMVAYLTAEFLPDINIFGYPVAGLCWLQLELNHSKATLLHKRWPEL